MKQPRELIKIIGSFFVSNIIATIYLIGNGIVVYGFFRINITTGTFALGVSFVLISLVLARERG